MLRFADNYAPLAHNSPMIAKVQIDELGIAGQAKIYPVGFSALAFTIPDPCHSNPCVLDTRN